MESTLHGQVAGLDDRLTSEWNDSIRSILKQHCGDCHMQAENEGGVNLDDYQGLEKIRLHASTWEQIRGVIRADAMPPPDVSELKAGDKNKLARWIQAALHDVDCGCATPVPQVTLRRLNQVEYDNTVCDLLGLDLRPSKEIGFVSDDVGNGFDNQGEVLSLPPIMLEKYLQAAAYIATKTIETDLEKFRKQRFEGEPLKFMGKQSIAMRATDGKYQVQVRMRFGDKQPDTCKARIAIDGTTIAEHEVSNKDESYKHEVQLDRGEHQLSIEYIDDGAPDKRGDTARRLMVDSIRINGPDSGLPAYPKQHEMLVISTPEQKDSPDGEPIGLPEASRRVFTKLLPKAYRRPVTADEVQAVVSVCENASKEGFSYSESLQFGLQAVLVAPDFLFRTERVQHGQALDDFGIATRLSYFLWSSTPDDALTQLAQSGALREPAMLKQQIGRMLESQKADALLSGFFAQWLGLRNLSKIDIDRTKFPGWNSLLRAAMLKETELFCGYLLRNGSIDEIANANYTFVNPRLAEFYGYQFEGKNPSDLYKRDSGRRNSSERRQGLYEDEDKWIRVELGNNRKGLLTHASVLALTSNPTRTSLVKRGKWILENVLGDPPPSAPPNVPSLESGEHKKDASIRELLEIHRSNPSCAGCHKLMDPIGLGLENFDAIGRWRERDGENPIDARGELSDGRAFEGPAELVALLAVRKPQILENFVARMLTYSLGRGLQRQDKCDIDRIVEHANQNSQSIRSIVEAIVMSDAFLQKPAMSPTESLTHAK